MIVFQDVSLSGHILLFLPLVAKVEHIMKKHKIEFRCTLYEKKLLKIKAKKAGITLSEFCRKSANEKNIIERLTEEQIKLYKMLIIYHNNFKSIGNMFKKKDPNLRNEVHKLADEIKNHLQNFK